MLLVVLLCLGGALLVLSIGKLQALFDSRTTGAATQVVFAWAGAGTLLATAVLSLPSYGMFVLPLAAGAVVWNLSRFALGRGLLGLLMGAGLALLGVGLGNLDYRPLPPSGVVTLAPGQTGAEYGGSDPTLWLLAGSLSLAVALLALLLSRWQRDRRPIG
jgi:hypothetical protein